MKDIEFREIEYGSKEYKDELQLRNRVLRLPLGLDIYDEDFKAEKNDMHLGAFYNGKLVGVLMLINTGDGMARMRQVAVDEGLRSRGIGRKLVEYAEKLALSRGYGEIMLHSRMTAKDFYTKLGYSVSSDVFTEINIPHVEMRKKLQ